MPRGSSLVDWRYDEAKIQGRLWTPRLFPASFLSPWYDFSAIETLTLDALTTPSGVIQVNDLSGNGNFAAQGTAGNRVGCYHTGKVNVTTKRYCGFSSAISFNGAMILNSSLTYSAGNGISIAAAANFDGTGSASVCGGTTAGLQLRTSSGTDVALLKRGVANLVTSSNSATTGGMNVLGCEAATNLSAVWLNGVRTGNSTDPAFTQPIINVFSSSGENFIGGIGEFLFFNGSILTTRQRNLVDGYLAWKWGCVQKLTASHPFLTRPPLIGD